MDIENEKGKCKIVYEVEIAELIAKEYGVDYGAVSIHIIPSRWKPEGCLL